MSSINSNTQHQEGNVPSARCNILLVVVVYRWLSAIGILDVAVCIVMHMLHWVLRVCPLLDILTEHRYQHVDQEVRYDTSYLTFLYNMSIVCNAVVRYASLMHTCWTETVPVMTSSDVIAVTVFVQQRQRLTSPKQRICYWDVTVLQWRGNYDCSYPLYCSVHHDGT